MDPLKALDPLKEPLPRDPNTPELRNIPLFHKIKAPIIEGLFPN